MRQSDSVSEELDTENVQCALDFENTMNELETQLYYRHLPPKEVALRVMETACKFYDADWCGLIQVDLDLGLWKPLWWHNECQEDKTTILTNEFESSEFLDRWVKAVRRGTPMVVSDAEDVKDTYPDEYRLYERLGIKSVLAIPLEPRQIALIAVRNPQRYTHQTSMLKLLAYVLLAAYNDKRMADSLSMPERASSISCWYSCSTVSVVSQMKRPLLWNGLYGTASGYGVPKRVSSVSTTTLTNC